MDGEMKFPSINWDFWKHNKFILEDEDDYLINEEYSEFIESLTNKPFSFIDNSEKIFGVNLTKKKENESQSKRFKVYNFFNPKLEDMDQIIINNKIQTKKILFLSRKKNRKEMKDNIIKKIKSRFFKFIKIILKERFEKNYNYKGPFKFLSQKFICDITKENNKYFWNETLLEFLENKLQGNNKYKILGFLLMDKIGEIKLQDLFNEYLISKEFEESIPCKKNEINVNERYINDYKINAKEFINYFTQETKTSK